MRTNEPTQFAYEKTTSVSRERMSRNNPLEDFPSVVREAIAHAQSNAHRGTYAGTVVCFYNAQSIAQFSLRINCIHSGEYSQKNGHAIPVDTDAVELCVYEEYYDNPDYFRFLDTAVLFMPEGSQIRIVRAYGGDDVVRAIQR